MPAATVLRVELPAPHPAQRQVKAEARRYNVVCCGRRWGKTTLGVDRLIEPALNGHPVAWYSPTYKMLSETWRELKRTLATVTASVSEQEHRLDLVTGGSIDCWSLERADGSRGRRYKRVVLDEAAMVRDLDQAWQAVIRPTLTDFEGDAWFLSTPRGLNYFHDLFVLGQDDPEYASWRMPSATNPYLPPGEIEAARRELPALVFAQEYEADFTALAESRFDRDAILLQRTLCRPPLPQPEWASGIPGLSLWQYPLPGVPYVQGSDCAEGVGGDRSCTVVLNARTLEHVATLCGDWEPAAFAMFSAKLGRAFNTAFWGIERNNHGHTALYVADQQERYPRLYWHRGDQTLNQLQGGKPAEARLGWLTTAQTKPELIDDLAGAIASHALVSHEAELWEECLLYEVKPNGSTGASEGAHDDRVMAAAIAVRMSRQPGAQTLRVPSQEPERRQYTWGRRT